MRADLSQPGGSGLVANQRRLRRLRVVVVNIAIQFDFLSYTFRPRSAWNWKGIIFTNFLPAIRGKASQKIVTKIRDWDVHRRTQVELEDLARAYHTTLRGWINYYGQYHKSALSGVLRALNVRLVRWTKGKYKRIGTCSPIERSELCREKQGAIAATG